MEQEKILNELINLPPAAQRQVVDFIAFLKTRYKPSSAKKPEAVLVKRILCRHLERARRSER